MDHSKEAAVRARAYQLWVESGYADGYQDQHWRQAEREVAEREVAERGHPGENGAGRATATRPDARPRGSDRSHSDGMSHHPSVLDPSPAR